MIVRHRILMSANQGEVVSKMIKAPCTKAGSPNEALFSNRHIPQTCKQRMSAPPTRLTIRAYLQRLEALPRTLGRSSNRSRGAAPAKRRWTPAA